MRLSPQDLDRMDNEHLDRELVGSLTGLSSSIGMGVGWAVPKGQRVSDRQMCPRPGRRSTGYTLDLIEGSAR